MCWWITKFLEWCSWPCSSVHYSQGLPCKPFRCTKSVFEIHKDFLYIVLLTKPSSCHFDLLLPIQGRNGKNGERHKGKRNWSELLLGSNVRRRLQEEIITSLLLFKTAAHLEATKCLLICAFSLVLYIY